VGDEAAAVTDAIGAANLAISPNGRTPSPRACNSERQESPRAQRRANS
jgi:hypothetical protein